MMRIMVRLWRRKPALVLLLAAIGVGMSFAFPMIARAGICWQGWQCDTGYFYGKGAATGTYPSEYDDVFTSGIPSNVTNLATFLTFMSGNLKCTSTDQPNSALGVAQNNQNATGASFIVLTMLGAPTKTAKNQACVRWTEWKNIVTSYDQAGLVNYNVNTAINSNLDTYFMPDFGGDVGFTRGTQPGYNITFYNADKTAPLYVIRRACGNPLGELTKLAPLNTVTGTGDINATKAGGNGGPSAVGGTGGGAAVDPTQFSSCEVISGHAFDPSAPNYAVPVTVSFSNGATTLQTFASTTGDHLYQVNTPDSVKSSLVPVVITAVGKAANGTNFLLANSPIAIGPCLVITSSCVNASTTPAVPEPNSSYSLRATVQYGNATQAAVVAAQSDFRFFVQVRGPDGPTLAYDNPAVANAVRNGNQITVVIDNMPPLGTSGTYTFGWGVTGTYGAVQCGSSLVGNDNPPGFASLNKPFFNVTGGDVSVGAAISPAGAAVCPASGPSARDDNASIVSWNIDAANADYRGAGTLYAAFALNHIQEFTTAQGSTALPREPSGLAFANQGLSAGQVNPTSGLYGGQFGGSGCMPDYFALGSDKAIAQSNITDLHLPGGNPNFPAGGNVPNGARLVWYVNGNLDINSDVKFSGNYANKADIPTFAVVVKGNIYIDPSVKQLDGIYIAQPSSDTSDDGNIYTCNTGPFQAGIDMLNKDLKNSCGANQLTVNGAFMARQVWLLRAAGTVTTFPAETFNYTPDTWMSMPFSGGGSTNTSDYDAITSLPPVL